MTAICHENPDADTIGAAVAIKLMSEQLGAKAEVVSADPPPPQFFFLPGVELIRSRPDLEPDLAVVCDAATLERVGRIAVDQVQWLSGARLLNVDHHVTNTLFGDLNLVDPSAAATCQVLFELVAELRVDLNESLATALLTGIVRDSHGFSDGATSGRTLRTAAALVEAGAPLADIHRYVLAELPYATMALWGRILATLGQAARGRVVYATLTTKMLEETGTQQHDADGLAEFLARTKGAAVIILLREVEAGTRVSLRTRGAVNAAAIAAAFGGGGHPLRAGCTVHSPLGTATSAVLAEVIQALGS